MNPPQTPEEFEAERKLLEANDAWVRQFEDLGEVQKTMASFVLLHLAICDVYKDGELSRQELSDGMLKVADMMRLRHVHDMMEDLLLNIEELLHQGLDPMGLLKASRNHLRRTNARAQEAATSFVDRILDAKRPKPKHEPEVGK